MFLISILTVVELGGKLPRKYQTPWKYSTQVEQSKHLKTYMCISPENLPVFQCNVKIVL